jgi:hypothetical protein
MSWSMFMWLWARDWASNEDLLLSYPDSAVLPVRWYSIVSRVSQCCLSCATNWNQARSCWSQLLWVLFHVCLHRHYKVWIFARLLQSLSDSRLCLNAQVVRYQCLWWVRYLPTLSRDLSGCGPAQVCLRSQPWLRAKLAITSFVNKILVISHNSKVLRVRPSFIDYCAILDFLAEAVAPL